MSNRHFESGPDARIVDVDGAGVCIKAVDHDYIFIDQGNANPIVVRGIPYSVMTHVRIVDGGVEMDERSRVTARRLDTFAEASPAAARRLGEICLRAAEIFVANHPADLKAAYSARLSNTIMRLDKEVDDMSHDLETKVRERDDLLRAEREIDGAPTPGM